MSRPRPRICELHALLDAAGRLGPKDADKTGAVPFWVPRTVTDEGEPIRPDVVMAVVVDTLLGNGLWPGAFDELDGGRLYHFTIAPAD